MMAVGCEEDAPPASAEPTADAAPEGPTWSDTVGPLVLEHCAGCHRAGGAAPFPLDSYESAAPMAAAVVNAVEGGRMPPWNPAPDCRDYERARLLPEGSAEMLRTWATADAPAGPGPDVPMPERDEVVFEATGVAMPPEPYMPDASQPDDYRCLVLDAEFDADVFVRGIEIVPDQGSLVHHVLTYAIPAADVPDLMALVDEDPEPGYSCFGGVGVGLPTSLGGWVPGSGALVWPGDRATYIRAGSKIVMQVHYNLATEPPAPDQTAVHLMAGPEPPADIVQGQPLATLDLELTAGDADGSITHEYKWYGDRTLEIVGIVGHMHLLGTRMSVEIVRDDEDECLLRIPRWDFAWQELFVLSEPAFVRTGERIRLTCHFDNSAENQPVVNGEQLTTRDVGWGEGTLDEMCFASMVLARPWDAEALNAPRCDGAEACRADCNNPDGLQCLMRCAGEDRSCAECLVTAAVQCVVPSCITELEAGRICLSHCILFGGDPDACMRDDCPAAYDNVNVCLNAVTADGSCTDAIEGCLN